MEELFKDPSYVNLIKELDLIKRFYSNPYPHVDVSGNITYILPYINRLNSITLFQKLNDLELTVSPSQYPLLITTKSIIRHKILSIISEIPLPRNAHETFLRNYELYLKNCEKTSEFFPESLYIKEYEVDPNSPNDPVETGMVSKYDLFDKWRKGSAIPDIETYEKSLKKICTYFTAHRATIHPESRYMGVQIDNNIDSEKLAGLLVNEGSIDSHHVLAFTALLSGAQHYEKINWKLNLSTLNKFISALHLFMGKDNKIEWAKFCNFFIVGGETIESGQLRTAFEHKNKSIQSLKPFGELVKSSLKVAPQ